MLKNFKEAVRTKDEIVLMNCSIDITRSQMEVALGKDDYDAVYFDGQHRPISEEAIVTFCAHAESFGMPVQMRLPHTRQVYLAGRFCDFGLSSIMVPEVMEEATVIEALEYFYYGNLGRRSWGGPNRTGLRELDDSPDRLEYAAWWNERAVLVLQFESVEAVANAKRLADRPGIDYVAFGPNDMAFSLERHTNFSLRTFEDCFKNVAEQLDPVGIKRCLAVAIPREEREKWRELGISIFWGTAEF